jgi:AraC-like DNA-binding protein
MRIIRPQCHWRVLFVSQRAPECLHRLALECGYRVGELTEALDCGERYLHEVFTRDIGMPPKLWMREERMVVARQLLGDGREPEAVAETLGFAAVASFRREFVRIYGVTPGTYQRRV